MNRFKELRLKSGYSSQAELAKVLFVNQTAVSQWERGVTTPSPQMLLKLSQMYGVSTDYLLGNETATLSPNIIDLSAISNIEATPDMQTVPVLGTIACGVPIMANENIEQYINVPCQHHCDFALRCNGDSMINARIFDGDFVLFRAQPIVDSGDIAAVLIDGDADTEATLKRVRIYPDHITLEPENSAYRPITFWDEEMARVHIIGKAVYFVSSVR